MFQLEQLSESQPEEAPLEGDLTWLDSEIKG